MPRVSVILPTLDRAPVLPRAIASVLAQTHHDLELIVVDDGSTDDTGTVVRAIGDPRVRYVAGGQRSGVSRARNRGIELARADWVAFQDSDDAWLPGRLAAQLALAADDVALIVTRDRVVNDAALSYDDVPAAAGDVVDLSRRALFRLPPAATWLARRATLQAAGGFDPALDCYEDWELALRLRAHGRILLRNAVLVERWCTPGSLFSDEPSRLRNLELIVDRHGAALRQDGRAWSYYCNALGQMTMQAGRAGPARRWFTAALRARPAAPRTWLNLCMTAFGRAAFAAYVRAARAVRSAARS